MYHVCTCIMNVYVSCMYVYYECICIVYVRVSCMYMYHGCICIMYVYVSWIYVHQDANIKYVFECKLAFDIYLVNYRLCNYKRYINIYTYLGKQGESLLVT